MVVLRDGDIRVIRNGSTLAQPFLSIPDVDTNGEGGLLSMAFSPDYLTSGRFYVFMVRDDADPGVGPPHGPIEIREYRRSAADPERADPASRRRVLEIAHSENRNHYGGTLQFGPDGLLYASVGDGGGSGDPQENGQNTFSKLGKLLRLDPRRLGTAPYRVPPTNPFVAGGGDPLVYAYGLRNLFRFSFDRHNGDLTIGDVGQNVTEEVDFVPSSLGRGIGADFGWNTCEGDRAYPDTSQPCTFAHTEPVYTYKPSGCASVTGGVVVRDPSIPALAGRYLFADYCATYLKSLLLAVPAASEETTLPVPVPAFGIAAFGEDACGRVHLVHLADSGAVKRLEDDAAPGSCNLTVTYRPPVPDQIDGGGGGQTITQAAPKLSFTLAGARRQRPLRSGNIGVLLRCTTACSARAIGTLTLRHRGRRIRLRQALGRRVSSGTLTLKLRLSRRGRGLVRRALRARRPVRAAVTVRVRDSGGRLLLGRRTIRLAR